MNTPATETKEEPQSREDKFFGTKTTIDKMRPSKQPVQDDKVDSVPAIEIEDDEADEQQAASQDTAEQDTAEQDTAKQKEELTGYSKNVQKRIDELTWKAKEAERQKSESERLRDEAVRYAQTVNQQNKQQADLIASGEATLVDQIKARAALAVQAAKDHYKRVYEEGDTDKIIAAQEALTMAQAEQIEAGRYDRDYQQRVQQWTAQQQQKEQHAKQQAYLRQQQQQRQPQQQATPQIPKPSEKAMGWTAKNPWFGKDEHRDMTAIAYAMHEKLIVDDGLKPDSDEYFNRIDETMRLRFPEYFAEQGQGQSRTARQPATVVAPGNRNNGGKPRTVRLKPSQVALAKKLGLTVEQYAAQVLKGEA